MIVFMDPLRRTALNSALSPVIAAALPASAASLASSSLSSLTLFAAPKDHHHNDPSVSNTNTNDKSQPPRRQHHHSDPMKQHYRTRAMLYMGAAMSAHFGGYEFFRSATLALFTSAATGFTAPTAYPLAMALVSPFSVVLLYFYSQQLSSSSPRQALNRTTWLSIAVVVGAAASLQFCQTMAVPKYVGQGIIWCTFLFQNSYQYLLYTQHWSFAGSVLTPDQAATWFPALAGCSSVVCSMTSSVVPYLLPYTGILGLMALTSVTMTVSLLCGDQAYAMAETHGFDPTPPPKKQTPSHAAGEGRVAQAWQLFRRVPTLSALFMETISFQSLNTILNVAFVQTLQQQIPVDVARAAYSGRFYGLVNAVSAALQFLVLPVGMKYVEPAWIWMALPMVPLVFCALQVLSKASSLWLVAGAVFVCKTMDYTMRSVIVPLVYQPLDFESRFLGKEIIGVFGSRFGKSGMSLLLSGLTRFHLIQTIATLNVMSLVAALGWWGATISLSRLIPRKQVAQAVVEERLEDKKSK